MFVFRTITNDRGTYTILLDKIMRLKAVLIVMIFFFSQSMLVFKASFIRFRASAPIQSGFGATIDKNKSPDQTSFRLKCARNRE